MNRIRQAVAAIAFALALSPLSAVAANLGVDITAPSPEQGGGAFIVPGFTVGWAFQVVTPVRVSGLGVWDEGSNGLTEGHAVGLWTGIGTLLASTTVPAGLGADSAEASVLGLGQWLFENIAPLTLQTGQYVVGSLSGNDAFRSRQAGIDLDPTLDDLDSGKFTAGSTLQFPEFDEGPTDFSIFGPNLLVEPVTVPTPVPAALVLLGLGFLGVGVRQAIRLRSR